MSDLNMDDLTLKMKELQGQMEGEFLANEMAKLDISLEEMPGLTEEQQQAIVEATARLESLGIDLRDDAYFSAEAQQQRMDDILATVTA